MTKTGWLSMSWKAWREFGLWLYRLAFHQEVIEPVCDVYEEVSHLPVNATIYAF